MKGKIERVVYPLFFVGSIIGFALILLAGHFMLYPRYTIYPGYTVSFNEETVWNVNSFLGRVSDWKSGENDTWLDFSVFIYFVLLLVLKLNAYNAVVKDMFQMEEVEK